MRRPAPCATRGWSALLRSPRLPTFPSFYDSNVSSADALRLSKIQMRHRVMLPSQKPPEGSRLLRSAETERNPKSPKIKGRKLRLIVAVELDRKSTRLNSSHPSISYA